MACEASVKKCAKQTQNGVPPPEAEHLSCPRCESTNTKFCYYNNYNFSQPRHFCKACRRYWTHGGTLRDVPFGGGSRKNAKRSRVYVPPTNTVPSTTPFLLPVDHGLGSFTSLFNIQGQGLLGPGIGPMGWPFAGGSAGFGVGGGGGGMLGNTWQLDSCQGGFVGGERFTM